MAASSAVMRVENRYTSVATVMTTARVIMMAPD